MNNKILFLSFLFVVILLSCTPIYIPNRVNAPMLDKPKEGNLEATIGSAGYDIQTAYSPIEHLGVMANFSTLGASGSSHTHSFFEGGIGYYNKIGETGLFEIYGGQGFGISGSSGSDYDYSRTFIQPSIGFLTDHANMYFATRLAYVRFGSNYTPLFIEPTFGGRVGGKVVKFNLQLGFSVATQESIIIDYWPFIFNFGLSFTLNK